MSAVIKPRRFKKIPASTPAMWTIIVLAAIFFVVRYGQEVWMQQDLNGKIVAQRNANTALSDENARLAASLQYFQSDKYVEQRAREDLNLRRSDEEVLIPIGDLPQAGTDASLPQATGQANEGQSPIESVAPEKPNWQKWFELFSPFDDSP